MSLGSPVAQSWTCYGLVGHLRGHHGWDRTVVDRHLFGRSRPAGVTMTAIVSGLRRTEPATSPGNLPGRWPPPARAALPVTISDTRMPATNRAHPDTLLDRLREMAPGDARRATTRAQLIEWYLPMSAYLARRFGGRGEPLADLTQVAAIGLIKAVDRYDPTRDLSFAGYAIRTIVEEIKRHFRDAAGNLQAPRRLPELSAQLAAAVDPGIDAVDRRETLRRALAALPVRERRIIGLRFVADLTQGQIAARIGVSQMHVSRLLTSSLTRLRDGMHADLDSPAPSASRAQAARQVSSPTRIARAVVAGPSAGLLPGRPVDRVVFLGVGG